MIQRLVYWLNPELQRLDSILKNFEGMPEATAAIETAKAQALFATRTVLLTTTLSMAAIVLAAVSIVIDLSCR